MGSKEPETGIVVGEVFPPIRYDLNRLGNVFYLLLAEIDESNGQLGADLIPHGTRDANPTRLRESLQPGRTLTASPKRLSP